MQSHLKINSVPIDHVNHQAEGPLGWITNGKIDLDLHILFPHTQETMLLGKVKEELGDIRDLAMEKIHDFTEKIPEGLRAISQSHANPPATDTTPVEAEQTKAQRRPPSYYNVLYPKAAVPAASSPELEEGNDDDYDNDDEHAVDGRNFPNPKTVVMYCNVRLNDLKAIVPLTTPDVSYLSNAAIRPVVAYLNAKTRSTVDIPFATELDLENFEGSDTVYEAGLRDVLAREIGMGVTEQVYAGVTQLPARIGVWGMRSLLGLVWGQYWE